MLSRGPTNIQIKRVKPIQNITQSLPSQRRFVKLENMTSANMRSANMRSANMRSENMRSAKLTTEEIFSRCNDMMEDGMSREEAEAYLVVETEWVRYELLQDISDKVKVIHIKLNILILLTLIVIILTNFQ